MKRKLDIKSLTPLAMLSQVGLSMIVPIILCGLLGMWIQKKFDAPDFVIVIAILLGVFFGGYSVYQLFVPIIKQLGKGKDKEI